MSRGLLTQTLSLALVFIGSFGLAQEPQSPTPIDAAKLFANDRISEIEITLDEKDWDSIRSQSRSFVNSLGTEPPESPFTYVRGDITIDGQLISDVGIRKKGFLGSLSTERPSLKIKFSEYREQSPIDGLDRLTLNNNKQDATRICQFLAYQFYRDSGTRGPRCGFAKVSVNGNYLGIYSNVESVKPVFLKRNFGNGTGDYFEGTIVDFFPEWIQKFEKKNKSASRNKIRAIAEVLKNDSVDLEKLNTHIDIDAFIKFWAMESLIGFWDGYCSNQNNFLIYENPANSKFYFIPWGTDSCFTQRSPIPPFVIRPKSVHSKSILPNKLYRIPETQKRYTETLMSFLEKHWNEEKIIAEIDRLEEMLKDDVLESNKSHASSLEKFRKFVTTRRRNIMREFKSGAPKLRKREFSPSYFAAVGTATAEFSTKWFDKTPKAQDGLENVQLNLMIDGEKVEMTGVYSYAEFSRWPSPDGPPPSIVLIGRRKSDNVKLTFGMSTGKAQFKPTDGQPISVTGIYFEGTNFLNPKNGLTMIGGTVILDQASKSDGEPVSGKLNLTIKQMRGGKPVSSAE